MVGGAVQATRYLFHDQLGSVVRIADANGALAEGLDFTAFGERRSYSDPNAAGSPSPTTPRGFTGHEMVDGTGIIHMNGRIYDAGLGRFLQPDPLVQSPDNAQNWNAYTYVFNNPLAYTDPTGLFSFRQLVGIAIAVIGTLVAPQFGSVWAKIGYAMAIGFASGYVATGTFKGGVIGAFSAGITMGIANAGGLDTWQKVGLQATTGGVVESLSGGKFGHGFVSAGVTASVMPQVGHIPVKMLSPVQVDYVDEPLGMMQIPSGASPTTTRGFTGHEMVDGTGVIHMNGRIYDSALGRFVQPDPLVQSQDNAQSWNAYTYVFNNPLADGSLCWIHGPVRES